VAATARLRIWARAFALATLIHLTLPDYAQAGWTAPGLLSAAGALWLLARPAAGGFALCLIGTLWPLLALRDVLTQSALLSLWAVLGLAATVRLAQPLDSKRIASTLDAVRLVTASTYFIAALHKLNTAFFDPTRGCAEHAWRQVADRYGLPDLPGAPWIAVATEITLGLLIWRRSRWMWPVGLAFHLPLTVTLAPAFGAVMLSGYVAGLDSRTLVRWRRAARIGRWPLLALGLAAAASELTWAARAEVAPALKTGAAAVILALSLLVARHRPRPLRRPLTPLPLAALALWTANGLTPYLGLQYQHTAAMLSGLRIDPGCHNSLVIPEALRLTDPYLRIDTAHFAHPRPDRERILRESLWNLPALYAMRTNWCIPENRPITLTGTWQGMAFHLPDLCAEDWRTHLPGHPEWLPGFQRFQKNLSRTCAQACVH